MSNEVEIDTKEIGGTAYRLRLIPTMAALNIVQNMEKYGFTPDVVFEVISKGSGIGSARFDQKKFDSQFAGKLQELMELFAEVLKYNKLFPEAEEGNEDGSED